MSGLLDIDDSFLDGVGSDDLTRQRSAIDSAVGKNPDAYAKTLNLSEKTGLPAQTVERNQAEVEKRATLQDIDVNSLFQDVPEAKEWAADPDNAALVSDDFSVFGRIKKTISDLPEAGARSADTMTLIDLRDREMNGTATPQDIILADEISKKMQTQLGTGGVFSDIATGAVTSSLPMANIFLESQKTGLATGLGFAGVAAAAGQLGPQAAAPEEIITVPVAARMGYKVGTAAGALKESYRQMRAMAYDNIITLEDANGNRIDKDTARGVANIVGLVSAPMESLGFAKILKTVPGGDALIGKLTKDGIRELLSDQTMKKAMKELGVKYADAIITEGSTEAMQQLAQDLGTEWAKANANKKGADFEPATVGDLAANAGYSFVIGGGVGMVYSTPGTLYSANQARKKYTRPEDIAAQAQALHQEVRSMPLMQRSPDRAHRLFQDIAGDERYYIDAEMVSQAVSALPEAQRQALFTAVPDLEVELSNAAETGADIAIKKADYAAFIAPYEQADILTEHLKLDPSEMSLSQRKTYTEFLAANPEVATILRQTANEQPNVSTKEYEKAIERVVRKSITDAGRGMPEARVLAPLFAKSFARRAQAVGINPLEFFSQNLVGFQTVDANGNVVSKGSNINVLLSDLEKVRAGKGNSLDAATRQAINDFGSRLEQSGLTLPEAQALDPQQLIDRLYPKQDPAQADAQRLDQMELPLNDIADGIDQIAVSMSAATNSIPGIAQILADAKRGDTAAHTALQDIARSTLETLTDGIPSVIIESTPATGLYGGDVEPSLGVSVRFNPGVREEVLAALAQFAENFNQEQIHVRGQSDAPVGTLAPDGSYTTEAFKIGLSRPLTRTEVDRIISESGLFGLTFADNYWEAYYVGEPENDAEIEQFNAAIKRAIAVTDEIGAGNGSIESGPQSLWIYGVGSGAIPYDTITGDLRSGADRADANARIIAEYFTRGAVKPREQSDSVTDPQRQIQRKIALDYEAMPDSDMNNPLVREAYEALRDAVIKQYRELPLKQVTAHVKRDADGNVVFDENGDPVGADGEPYKNSAQMRKDVRTRNRMTFYATTKSTFGPEGIDFSGHPLLEPTEFRDKNGYQLLVNDVLRVVHDYYAHNLTATNFGPRGEEAAWVNHMTTIDNPMARWALTSETRGQNSWVNFRPGAELIPKLIDRGFARQKAALLPIEYSLTGDAEIDAPMQALINSLTPEQQNGSVPADARATDDVVAQAFANDNEVMQQGERRRLMQSATAQAQRNGIGLYSMVEKQIMEMQLPQWKPSKQKLLTDEQRARLAELMQSVTSTADPDYQERLNLATLERKEKGVAKGTEIWQKVEKLPVKKEELEWLGLKEFLTGSPNEDFTRDEVVEFVRSNGVQIEEIIADQDAVEGSIDWGSGEAIEDDAAVENETEYYRDEAKPGGSYEDEYFSFVVQVAENNLDDQDTQELVDAVTAAGSDGVNSAAAKEALSKLADHVSKAYEDDLNEAVDEWARERGHDAYYDNPYYRYTTDNGEELTGNDDIGWSLTFSNGKTEFLDAYSLNEAQIRANDRLMESGDYTSEDSPDAKKWEDYTTPGSYDNYRERKLTLPGVEGDFYYDTHFPDRNIVAFSRETDRWLAGEPDVEKSRADIATAQGSSAARDYRDLIQRKQEMEQLLSDVSKLEYTAQYQSGYSTVYYITRPDLPDIGGITENFTDLDEAKKNIAENNGEALRVKYISRIDQQIEEAVVKFSEERQKKRTFFIDEFQSDWHQQGRSQGYEGEVPNVTIVQDEGGIFRLKDDKGQTIEWRGSFGYTTEEMAQGAREDYQNSKAGDIAQAPFKGDGWLALGLKRALVDAVEKGYDRFAWADADVLADRWSERYRTLYETQYDTKMPSAVKRLTGVQPQHVMNSRELRGQGYWYIDIDEKLRNEIRGNSFPLFQDARGYIDFEDGLRKVVITFTEKANFSTGVHEFSHWAVASHRMFADVARQKIAEGDDNPELQRIVDDWEALKRKVGATGDKFTVDQEEMVARMFEAYMREGNAPSEEMRSVFTRFRDWLTKIYQDMTRLGYDLDDETRGVFDRWLAAENEIQKLKDKNQTFAMIAQQLGLSPEVQTKIADYVNGALVKAEEKLFRELRSEQKARDSAEYKDAFAKMRVKVAEEFEKQKEYALVKYMRDNGFKFLEGPETINVQRDILAKQEDNATTVPPDDVAEMFGYKSGQEMLKKLKNLTNFDRAVDYETRKRMQADYPDMAASGKIGDVALDAMYNDRTLLALDTMINEIGKATGQNRVNMRQFAKVLAQQQLMKMRLDETGYAFRWDAARDKEMRNALQFARNKAPQMAMLSLQKAMVNHMLFKQLNQFNQEKEKAYDLFKRVNAKDKTLAPSSDIDFVGAARGILHKFGMAREGFDIAQWLDDVNERDPSIRQDLIGMVNMVRVQPKPAKDLTVAEFIDIRDAVTNIMWVARSLKKIEREGKEIEREKIIMQLTQQLDGLPQSRRKTLTQTSGDKMRSWAMSFKSSTRRVEQWVNAIDGGFGGVTRTNIWDPIVTADNQYKDERPKWFRELNKILQASKDHIEQRGKIDAPELSSDMFGGVFRDRLELIGWLLHTGNESNMEKLLDGYGINRANWDAFLTRAYNQQIITDKDMKVVQDLWNFAERLKPMSQRAHKKLYGYRFDEIEPRPITTPFGTYAGGYWPAIVDYSLVEDGDIRQAQDQANGIGNSYMIPATGKGFTMKRVDGYRRPLSVDLRLATSHVDKVLRFSILEPAVRDVSRIVNNKDYREVLQRVDEFAGRNMLNPWLQRVARQETEMPLGQNWKWMAPASRFLRSSASAQTMMLNLLNAMQNVTGFSVSIYKVGVGNWMRANMRYAMNPFEANREVRALSTEMRVRQNIEDIDITNAVNDIILRRGKVLKAKNWAIKHGYVFQRLIQNYVDNVTWMAAFDQHSAEGNDQASSIRYADSIVRTTQGSTSARDISSIEAGSAPAKLFLMFYSYFNNISNLIGTEATTIIRRAGWKGAPELFYMYLMTAAIPFFVSEFIVKGARDALPEDEDDDGLLDEYLAWFGMSQVRGTFAAVPYAGQVANAFMNRHNDQPMDDRISISPVVSLTETTVRFLDESLFDDGYNDNSRMVRDALTAIGFMTGLPLGQFGKPVGYIADVQEGDTEPENVVDFGMGLIAGPPPANR